MKGYGRKYDWELRYWDHYARRLELVRAVNFYILQSNSLQQAINYIN